MSRISTPAKSSISLGRRVRACWRLKLALLAGLTTAFCVPYVFLAHHAFFPVRSLPLLWIDRRAGFDPDWVWVYQSVYLLTGTLPWLATSREQLMRYVRGFIALATISFAIYVFFPVQIPRPFTADPTGLYWLLLLYDGPYNAIPSLHAGFLYYTLAFARRVFGPPPTWIAMVLISWSLLILWSTLATKEHYAVDLVAGIALAVVCDLAAWRSRLISVGEKSHAGVR